MLRDDKNILSKVCVAMTLLATLLIFEFFQLSYASRAPRNELLTDEKFSFRLRDGNRKEGILRRKPVSGGVNLISATIEFRDETASRDTLTCFVGFFLEQKSQVQITIQHPERLYKMTPLKRAFPPGFSRFGWPRDAVLKPLDVDLYSLYAVAEIQNSVPLEIAPVVLFHRNPPPDTIAGYRFIFSTDTRSDFKYRILKPTSSGDEIICESHLVDQPPGEVLITWDGRDKDGQFVKDGSYQLKIAITLHSRYRRASEVIFIRNFYHKCKIP